MFWSTDWAWGLPVVVLTIVVHVVALVLISEALVRTAPPRKGRRGAGRFILAVALTALVAAILHGLEAGLWAVLYVGLGALPDVHDAILYSLGAITTFGHASIFLEHRWQLLGTIEAVNGVLLFGLTTAFLFAAIQAVSPLRTLER